MSDRVWVVTGANSGLGLAIALTVLSKGDKCNHSQNSETLKNAGAKSLVVNFSDSDETIKQAAEDSVKIYGKVDILVNNAGNGLVGPVEELDAIPNECLWPIAFSQPIIAHLRQRRTGHILNMSSLAALGPYPAWGAYCASKAALEAFSDSLSQELALFNVRVLVVIPGYFSSDFFHNLPSQEEETSKTDNPSTKTKIYLDPMTQGYDAISAIPSIHVAQGQIGDAVKLGERLYEVVTGTGLAKELVPGRGGKRDWIRVPLGPDSGERLLHQANLLEENTKVFESIWRSTDVEPQRLKFFPRG